MPRLRLSLIGLAAVVAAAACRQPDPAAEATGAILGTPVPKPDFVMTATDGAPFDFRKQTAGTLTFLYFGYTMCPDVCPAQMANIAAALKRVSPADRGRVRVVFVTTDPARDTLPALRAWLDRFDSTFIGLRASVDSVHALERAVSVVPSVMEHMPDGSLGGYGVGHAAQVVAFTPDDTAHVVYPFGVTQDNWVHDIKLLLHSRWAR